MTGHWLYLLFAPAIIHIAIPILDLTFGEDFSNPPESAVESLNKDFFYRALVWLYVPFQLIGTVYGTWLAATQSLDWYAYIVLVFTVGSTNGIGIGTAHELGHKQESVDRWLSKLALASSMYGHFFVEHNRGHHKRVATPEDPASARMGESFWAFLPRTVLGSLISAWELERERLKRKGRVVWSIQNENLQAWSLTILLVRCSHILVGMGGTNLSCPSGHLRCLDVGSCELCRALRSVTSKRSKWWVRALCTRALLEQ